jgi:hypothetical protein
MVMMMMMMMMMMIEIGENGGFRYGERHTVSWVLLLKSHEVSVCGVKCGKG